MMTLAAALIVGRLKEAAALTRVTAAIAIHCTDPDWLYVRAALEAKLHELRALLAQEDPALIDTCVEWLDAERHAAREAEGLRQPLTAPSPATPPVIALDVPTSARIH